MTTLFYWSSELVDYCQRLYSIELFLTTNRRNGINWNNLSLERIWPSWFAFKCVKEKYCDCSDSDIQCNNDRNLKYTYIIKTKTSKSHETEKSVIAKCGLRRKQQYIVPNQTYSRRENSQTLDNLRP